MSRDWTPVGTLRWHQRWPALETGIQPSRSGSWSLSSLLQLRSLFRVSRPANVSLTCNTVTLTPLVLSWCVVSVEAGRFKVHNKPQCMFWGFCSSYRLGNAREPSSRKQRCWEGRGSVRTSLRNNRWLQGSEKEKQTCCAKELETQGKQPVRNAAKGVTGVTGFVLWCCKTSRSLEINLRSRCLYSRGFVCLVWFPPMVVATCRRMDRLTTLMGTSGVGKEWRNCLTSEDLPPSALLDVTASCQVWRNSAKGSRGKWARLLFSCAAAVELQLPWGSGMSRHVVGRKNKRCLALSIKKKKKRWVFYIFLSPVQIQQWLNSDLRVAEESEGAAGGRCSFPFLGAHITMGGPRYFFYWFPSFTQKGSRWAG